MKVLIQVPDQAPVLVDPHHPEAAAVQAIAQALQVAVDQVLEALKVLSQAAAVNLREAVEVLAGAAKVQTKVLPVDRRSRRLKALNRRVHRHDRVRLNHLATVANRQIAAKAVSRRVRSRRRNHRCRRFQP